ncbi:MAG: phosphoribosyl-ATP diphosphatase, partial [Firmicutes bacterium]|nr:phosphoribosyl-ATP diphosphatase [Bacillota bacterium]
VSITADCDRDALVVMVEKDGPACHLGTDSCFEYPLWQSEELHEFSMDGLMELLKGRKEEMPEGSYTSYLFEKGIDKILKKVGEESTEVIVAAKGNDKRETIYEIADLAYHVMVLMTEMGISTDDVRKELASRHIIDHKVKQEKMV